MFFLLLSLSAIYFPFVVAVDMTVFFVAIVVGMAVVVVRFVVFFVVIVIISKALD